MDPTWDIVASNLARSSNQVGRVGRRLSANAAKTGTKGVLLASRAAAGLMDDGAVFNEPSWPAELELNEIEIDGYAVLVDEDGCGPRTKPCGSALEYGDCEFIGLVMTVADSLRGARWAAVRELATARLGGAPPLNERWIHRVWASLPGYDLHGVVDRTQAEFVRQQLLNGDGDEDREAAWDLAKRGGCDAILLPTAPSPTLFVYERCRGYGFNVTPVSRPIVFA